MTIEAIARLAHQLNKAYCEQLGDVSQVDWEKAPDWQKHSAILGVEFHLKNPDATDSASHECWLAEKEREGWKYGEVKDVERKEHPCFVPFDQLPVRQKLKDALFRHVVKAVTSYPSPEMIGE